MATAFHQLPARRLRAHTIEGNFPLTGSDSRGLKGAGLGGRWVPRRNAKVIQGHLAAMTGRCFLIIDCQK